MVMKSYFLMDMFAGSRKSLLDVFQNSMCHPSMAMVIDDRLKVWEDRDQPRVHMVPAFTPYYAPLAEVMICVYYHLIKYTVL